MPKKYSEKREAIIRRNEEAIRNYSAVRGDISKVRGKLDLVEGKIDENIDRLYKANRLYEAFPEKLFLNPSPVLCSLIASGSAVAEGVYAHSEHFKGSFQRIRDETDSLIATTAVVDVSGNTTLNISSSAAKTAAPQYPQIGELMRELELPSPLEKRKELESELRKISKQLADMYVGAWQTMQDTSKQDRIRQSSHSMRDLLSQFLDFLAPTDKVKQAEWYVPEHKSRKPTQTQRAKYAIMGERSEKMFGEKDLKMIDVLIKDVRKAYEDLSRLSHSRKEENSNLAESYMKRCEDIIRGILELRKRFYISS